MRCKATTTEATPGNNTLIQFILLGEVESAAQSRKAGDTVELCLTDICSIMNTSESFSVRFNNPIS